MEDEIEKLNTSESAQQALRRPVSLHALELKIIRAKSAQRRASIYAERWIQAVFSELEDRLGIIPNEVPTEAKNASTLEEAIWRYILFDEYSRVGILRDTRAAQNKKAAEEESVKETEEPLL